MALCPHVVKSPAAILVGIVFLYSLPFLLFIISNLNVFAFEKKCLAYIQNNLFGGQEVKEVNGFQEINVQPVSSSNLHRRY